MIRRVNNKGATHARHGQRTQEWGMHIVNIMIQ